MDTVQYISETGEALKELPFSDDELLRGYCALRRTRFFDERAVTLQRQGKLGVYPPCYGQEAAQVGSALALEKTDWIAPSYRENAAALVHGLTMKQLILFWRAHPAGWRFPDDLRLLPFYIPIATQIPQAVGVAQAGKLQGENWVSMTYIGDGGTSEGDFHEGLNFAAVFDAPVVFVVQNNGWAISVPTSKQMKNTRIAERAKGYGMPGVVVDGNDLVAVWKITQDAVARARAGDGPTLIEALTYRIAPHTTSDDPGRYRSENEAESWRKKDPIKRMQTLLKTKGLWDDEQEEALEQTLKDELTEAVREADEVPEPEAWEIVEHVFAEMTPEQSSAWEALHGN